MELRHLRYFVAVAEELHFGHAASRLHTSQPSLSQQIRDLERELKVDLFLRTKRRVALTPAGRRFLQEARGILSSAERAAGLAREAERDESRKLAVGISPETDWLFLGKALRLFAEQAPSVDVVFQNLRETSGSRSCRKKHTCSGRGICRPARTTNCSPYFGGPVLGRRSPRKEGCPQPEPFWA